jgi:hypothetical protein
MRARVAASGILEAGRAAVSMARGAEGCGVGRAGAGVTVLETGVGVVALAAATCFWQALATMLRATIVRPATYLVLIGKPSRGLSEVTEYKMRIVHRIP